MIAYLVGLLALARASIRVLRQGGEFGDADLHAVGVLADWAAIAVDHAHLFRESVERAAELEHAVEGLQATTAIARVGESLARGWSGRSRSGATRPSGADR